jgi:dihydrofolate reductase
VMATTMAEGMTSGGAMLFGRRTYQQFASYWPHQPDENPYAAVLNGARKYVASTTLSEPLPWANSTLLEGAAGEAVAALKRQPGNDLTVLGSGELVRSLLAAGLVDLLVLSIHPLLLGEGRRLFADDGTFAKFRLVEAKPTTTGVVIATYRPAEAEAPA